MRSLLPTMAVAVVILAACSEAAEETTTTAATRTTVAQTPTTTTTVAETTTTAQPDDEMARIHVVYREGEVVEGEGRHRVVQGSEVEITVEADQADEVHVHGYDLFAEVTPDEPAVIRFTADIPGIFEVELEGTHRVLFELRVDP